MKIMRSKKTGRTVIYIRDSVEFAFDRNSICIDIAPGFKGSKNGGICYYNIKDFVEIKLNGIS